MFCAQVVRISVFSAYFSLCFLVFVDWRFFFRSSFFSSSCCSFCQNPFCLLPLNLLTNSIAPMTSFLRFISIFFLFCPVKKRVRWRENMQTNRIEVEVELFSIFSCTNTNIALQNNHECFAWFFAFRCRRFTRSLQ